MELVTEPRGAIDLTATPVHLALGSRALAVEGFEWDGRVLEAYAAASLGVGGTELAAAERGPPWS